MYLKNRIIIFLYFFISFCLLFFSFHFLHISLFRFVLVDFVLLSLVSFHFVLISLISFRFRWFCFVSFRFYFVSHFIGTLFSLDFDFLLYRFRWILFSFRFVSFLILPESKPFCYLENNKLIFTLITIEITCNYQNHKHPFIIRHLFGIKAIK